MTDTARKIGALLAKAERTDNPHEAEAFTRKAEALMVKYRIDEAMARRAAGADVRPEEIIERCVGMYVPPASASTWRPRGDNPSHVCSGCGEDLPASRFPTTKSRERGEECRRCRDARVRTTQGTRPESNTYNAEHIIGWHAVATALGADTYKTMNNTAIYIVGFRSDVDRIELLCHSLKAQVMVAMWSWWKTNDWPYWSAEERVQARREFVVSFYGAVALRLTQRTRQAADATPGATLALRDRKSDLIDHMAAKNLNEAKIRSYEGSPAGARAGREANLGDGELGGRRAIVVPAP